MKPAFLTAFLTLILLQSKAQSFRTTSNRKGTDTAYRSIRIGADSFLIRYEYNTGHWMDTMVGRMIEDSTGKMVEDIQGYIDNRHYNARIAVFEIKGNDKRQIGRLVFGKYVPAGCFEDDPLTMVAKAKAIETGLPLNDAH